MFAAGAVSITLLSEADEPVLEPAPGETPLWSTIRLQALFPLSVDLKTVTAEIDSGIDVRFVGDIDWQAHARSFAVDEVFAERLHLRPPLAFNETYLPQGRTPLFIEPGLAFGSGSHPTTRMCLQWLAEHIQEGMKVLDFGCGSGVLAIGAALLGAEVVAVDHDEQAVAATQENAQRNNVSARLTVLGLTDWRAQNYADFNVVIANILAEPLRILAKELVAAVSQDGFVVLSGLLQSQAGHVKQAYQEDIVFTDERNEGEWSLLVGVKSGRST